MNCPYCGYEGSRVIDSRDVDQRVRRRRECQRCNSRFTTYERVTGRSLFVIKKDKRREEFNREKLAAGIRKACEKRPLPAGTSDKLCDEVEAELYHLGKLEVPSSVIGDMVMERLRTLDHIAYIRFASVYRQFTDIASLKQAVDSLVGAEEPASRPPGQLPLIPEGELSIPGRGQARRNRK